MSRFFSEWHDKTHTFAANFPFVEWFRTAVAVRTMLIVLIAILLVARRCAARDIIIVLAVILLILLWGFSSRISCSLECVIAFCVCEKEGTILPLFVFVDQRGVLIKFNLDTSMRWRWHAKKLLSMIWNEWELLAMTSARFYSHPEEDFRRTQEHVGAVIQILT